MAITFSIGKKQVLYVDGANGENLIVNYVLVERDGATYEMILETVKHFAFLCWALAQGYADWQENDKWNTYKERSQYEPCEHDRVLITYANAYVHDGTTAQPLEINTFTENTVVIDAFNRVWQRELRQKALDKINNAMKREDLTEVFPREAPEQKPAQKPTQQSKPQESQEENKIEYWDNRKREEYESTFANQIVIIRFGAWQRVLSVRRDGTGAYERIHPVPVLENGQLSKYVAQTLGIYVPKSDKTDVSYDYKKLNQDGFVDTYLSNSGDLLKSSGWARYKVNTKDGKVYWNLYGVTFDDPLPEQPTQLKPEQQPVIENTTTPHGEDIPF